jgi:hypothetical protein
VPVMVAMMLNSRKRNWACCCTRNELRYQVEQGLPVTHAATM